MEFLYPQVLYGLFALAIPIVIHLFNFRRYQKVWFNNVALLKTIQKKTKKQSQLKHLLVLLMRLLTITALVLAFSGPYFPNKNASDSPQSTEYVSIYLDNSFSMTHLGENGSLLNEAQNMALSILESYQNNDRFQLITNQMESKHFRWFNKMEMLQNIMEIEAVHMQQDLGDIFQREKMLRNQDGEDVSKATLYLLSDFQKNTFFNSKIEVDTSLKVRLLPLQNNPVNNLSVDTVFFYNPIQLPGRESTISVEVSNNGNESQNAIPLRLFVDGEQKAVLTLDIESGKTESFDITFSNTTAGKKIARLEIDDYPIVYDDRLFFTYEVREEFNAALIYSRQANPFLRKLYREDSLVKLNIYPDKSVDYSELSQQDLVVIDELNLLSSGLQKELENYLQNGGHLLIIPSENMDINSWLSSLSCPIYKKINKSPTRLDEVDKQNPFFDQVFESQWAIDQKNQKIDVPEIHQFYEFGAIQNSTKLLQTRSAQAILLATAFGNGSIYQLAFPLKKTWSGLPEHALFVAVFYQMVLQSDQQSRPYETVGSDQPLKLKGLESELMKTGDRVVKLKMDEEEWIPQMSFNRASEVTLSQIQWPVDGMAEVRFNEEVVDQIAVNYNRKESDFKVWNKEELANLIAENKWPKFQIIASSPDKITAKLIELNESKQVWRWFLILGIFFIFAETIILRFWK